MMLCIMSAAPDTLPDDVEALKALVAAQSQQLGERDALIDKQLAQLQHKDDRIDSLKAQIHALLDHRFGRSSEKLGDADASQHGLFDEAEIHALEDSDESEQTVTEVTAHKRRGKRAPLPVDLPRIEIVHDLLEHQKICPHDGTPLKRIGEQTAERLDIIPMKVQVLRDVRLTYACPCCHSHVLTADKPAAMVSKSMASEGLLAYVAASKYIDGLPLNRISYMLARIGVDIPRHTLADWMVRCGEQITPIIDRLYETLKRTGAIQMDETGVQVLNEPGKQAQSKSYMGVSTGGDEIGTPIRLFHYAPSRSGQAPIELLEGFKGSLQTDGYEGYAAAIDKYGLSGANCWAHCRRYYIKALKAAGITNLKQIPAKPPPKAKRLLKGLKFIQRLYEIERLIKGKPPDERQSIRQEKAGPILVEFKQWIEQVQSKVLPSAGLGQALAYTTNHWAGLNQYINDGRLEIDTNRTENSIRPFVVGRKAWLFSATQGGARASANRYSLIETAKANGHEPYAYLRKVFERLSNNTDGKIDDLLPWNLSTT